MRTSPVPPSISTESANRTASDSWCRLPTRTPLRSPRRISSLFLQPGGVPGTGVYGDEFPSRGGSRQQPDRGPGGPELIGQETDEFVVGPSVSGGGLQRYPYSAVRHPAPYAGDRCPRYHLDAELNDALPVPAGPPAAFRRQSSSRGLASSMSIIGIPSLTS